MLRLWMKVCKWQGKFLYEVFGRRLPVAGKAADLI